MNAANTPETTAAPSAPALQRETTIPAPAAASPAPSPSISADEVHSVLVDVRDLAEAAHAQHVLNSDRLTALGSQVATVAEALDTPERDAAIAAALHNLAKPGKTTSEFALSVTVTTSALLGALAGLIPGRTGIVCATLSSLAFVASRFFLKRSTAALLLASIPR